jgi:uncharacterized protein affecting Mg2+/Co2+ transport
VRHTVICEERPLKTVKQAAGYTIFQRNDGRYAVRGQDRRWVNGDAKVDILVGEGLLKQQAPKPKAEAEPASEAEAQDGESTDADEDGA